jgi:2,3-dihydroxybenzoate decarboxylase
MKYIALEEAFAVPGLAQRQPPTTLNIRMKPGRAEELRDRLVDFNDHRLREMDAYGIEIQVLSLGVPGIQADVDPRRAVENAILANDFLAGVIAENPARFRGFAALPMQDPVAAIEELHRCIDKLGFCGAMVCGHTQGHYLDEPHYEEFWGELEAIGRPLYLHPGSIDFGTWRVMAGYPEMYGAWSWAAETGGHALRLLYGGVFDRHPYAHVILGHMGEFLPFQRSRLDSRYLTIVHDRPLQRMPSEYIGTNIVLTNSGVFDPAVLAGAVAAVGADAVMFSVDYPYESTSEAIEGFEKTELSEPDRAKIAYQNAQRILKL